MSHCLGGEEMFLWTRVYLVGKGGIFRVFFCPSGKFARGLFFTLLSCPMIESYNGCKWMDSSRGTPCYHSEFVSQRLVSWGWIHVYTFFFTCSNILYMLSTRVILCHQSPLICLGRGSIYDQVFLVERCPSGEILDSPAYGYCSICI